MPVLKLTFKLLAFHVQAAEGRACVIAVNKWDTIPVKTDKTLADYEADVRAQVCSLLVLLSCCVVPWRVFLPPRQWG